MFDFIKFLMEAASMSSKVTKHILITVIFIWNSRTLNTWICCHFFGLLKIALGFFFWALIGFSRHLVQLSSVASPEYLLKLLNRLAKLLHSIICWYLTESMVKPSSFHKCLHREFRPRPSRLNLIHKDQG